MATKTLQKNFQHTKSLPKSLIIEMNETPGESTTKESFFKSSISQTKNISYIQSQIQGSNQHHQGSILSLTSRSCFDLSDVQPLTEVHPCRYDECNKFHNTNANKESGESPSSSTKNVLLYLVIVLLLLWIIIYTALTQFNIL